MGTAKMHGDAMKAGMLLKSGLAVVVVVAGCIQVPPAVASFGTWPPVELCESWIDPEAQPSDEATARRSAALLDHLRDPRSSYELAFRSRMARAGAIFADGEQLDVDVPVITADLVGTALVAGPDYLAFLALAEGPWSLAEMRRDGDLYTRIPRTDRSWLAGAAEEATGLRLPDVLASASEAMPVVGPAGQAGHWYALDTAMDLPPGLMWDNTLELFPVVRDTHARLFVETAEDGSPVAACLQQGWWQGYDDVIGEDASLLSAIRFSRLGTAPPLPPVSWPSERVSVRELDLELPVPQDGESRWDGDRFWIWLDGQDEQPSLSIRRSRYPDWALSVLRTQTLEQVLEDMAKADATSAKTGWDREPMTVEPARIGGADGETPVPARLLTFHPDFDDIGPAFAIDVVTFVDPWAYHFQYLAPIDNELADRYLLERTLEGARFLCSTGESGACPPSPN